MKAKVRASTYTLRELIMSHKNLEQKRNVHKFDWSNGVTIEQAKDMILYLVDKLQQAMNNPLLPSKSSRATSSPK